MSGFSSSCSFPLNLQLKIIRFSLNIPHPHWFFSWLWCLCGRSFPSFFKVSSWNVLQWSLTGWSFTFSSPPLWASEFPLWVPGSVWCTATWRSSHSPLPAEDGDASAPIALSVGAVCWNYKRLNDAILMKTVLLLSFIPCPLDGLDPPVTGLHSVCGQQVLSHLFSPEDDGEAQLQHSAQSWLS